MSGPINIGNRDSVNFNYLTGNAGKGEIEAKLHLSNGKKYTIKMNVKSRAIPMDMTNKFSPFTSEKGAMRKLASGATLSTAEARKAFQGLAKLFQSSTQSQAKTEIVQSMMDKSVLQDTSDIGLASICGPDQLKKVYEQRDQAIFSAENARHYGELMGAIFEKALNDSQPQILKNKISELQTIIAGKLSSYSNGEISKEKFLNCVIAMKKAVIQQLDQLLGKGQGAKCFRQYYPKVTSESTKTWTTFSQTFDLVDREGNQAAVTASLKPANQMGCFSYLGGPEQPKGVSSLERTTEHAMNLWETEIKSEQSGKPLFQAIRHGCTRGQENASREILVACLAQKIGMEDLKNNPGTREQPIPLQLANIQLMTPGGRLIDVSTDGSCLKNKWMLFELWVSRNNP
ncbi:MAG: hypothetical protein LBJ13_02875 [Puniceicoccales bacterium]|jgi:hypothetical protein|nr:hypothetical protein [Puniceicoccales bacterium]